MRLLRSHWLAVVALIGVSAVVVALAAVGTATSTKKERDVTIDQVPAAVKATILKEAGDNKIEEIEEISKDGKVVCYEAEWEVDGKEIEITVAPDGKLLKKEVEDADDDDDDDGDDDDGDDDDKEVTIAQVPAAVKATILKEAGDNKIEEIEEISKDGKVVCYEAEWEVDGKEIEITVAPDGKLLTKEVEDADDDDDDD